MILWLLEQFYDNHKILAILLTIALSAHCILKPRKKQFPGPFAVPIIGCIPTVLPYLQTRKTNIFFQDMGKKYGKNFSVNFGVDILCIGDANEVNRVLNSSEFYRDNTVELALADFIHHGLFTLPSTDDRWARHRKILQPAFGPKQLKYASKIISQKANELIRVFEAQCKKGEMVLDLKPAIKALTIDIIGMVAFRHNFNTIEDLSADYSKISESVQRLDDVGDVIMGRFFYPFWAWRFFGLGLNSRKILECSEPISNIIKSLIQTRRADKPVDINIDSWDKDVLERLLFSKNDDGDRFSDEEIIGELQTFFIAGHETTSNELLWLVAMLCEHSEFVSILRREIDPIMEKGGDFYEEIPKLKYLDCFVKETMRIYPVGTRLLRKVAQDIEIGGYEVSKNTLVLLLIENIHMDPENWPEPEKFNPERFLEKQKPNTFIPFGGGPMNCIGQKLALLEMKITLMHLLYNFDIKYAKDFFVEPELNITLGMPKLNVNLTTRC